MCDGSCYSITDKLDSLNTCSAQIQCEFDLVPAKSHGDDACFDIRSSIDCCFNPHGDPIVIPTGLRIALPEGWEVQVRGRSGLAFKENIMVFPGTIDAGYRGEIKILMFSLKRPPMFYRIIDFFKKPPMKYIKRGDRIAQIKFSKVSNVSLNRVSDFSVDNGRGESGFGSTGVK